MTDSRPPGKTTVSRRIEYAIAQYLMDESIPKLEGWTHEEKLGIIHLEEDEEESINSLYAIDIGVDEKDFVVSFSVLFIYAFCPRNRYYHSCIGKNL